MRPRASGFALSLLSLSIMPTMARADAYVNQLDRTPLSGSVFIQQLPEGATPVAPRPQRKKTVRRQAPASVMTLPNIGAGVSLALISASSTDQLPSVGSGVIKR